MVVVLTGNATPWREWFVTMPALQGEKLCNYPIGVINVPDDNASYGILIITS